MSQMRIGVRSTLHTFIASRFELTDRIHRIENLTILQYTFPAVIIFIENVRVQWLGVNAYSPFAVIRHGIRHHSHIRTEQVRRFKETVIVILQRIGKRGGLGYAFPSSKP